MTPEHDSLDTDDKIYERKLKRIAATAEVIYTGFGLAAGDGTYIAVDHGIPVLAAATALLGATLVTGAVLFEMLRRKEYTKEKIEEVLYERRNRGKKGA